MNSYSKEYANGDEAVGARKALIWQWDYADGGGWVLVSGWSFTKKRMIRKLERINAQFPENWED